jgi:hypothetical protein
MHSVINSFPFWLSRIDPCSFFVPNLANRRFRLKVYQFINDIVWSCFDLIKNSTYILADNPKKNELRSAKNRY